MKMRTLWSAVVLFCCISCTKVTDIVAPKMTSSTTAAQFVQYTISKGGHYADKSTFNTIETGELKFAVKFDSSAIYQTTAKNNQYDINKLYGFSDNNTQHHEYSARFGWRWSDGALRLFAYVYNAGKVTSQEVGIVSIGKEAICSIKVSGSSYIFTLNGVSKTIARKSTTPLAKGYQLYPYFGGDEVAPHEVKIWIKNL